MYSGITSVTFRHLECRDIIKIAKEAGLKGIEWGADVHMMPGMSNAMDAINTVIETRRSGLKAISIGSYYHAGIDPINYFYEVMQIAVLTKIPVIRVWAGGTSPKNCSKVQYNSMINDLKIICKECDQNGIIVGLEYHRGTLTENAFSALNIIRKVRANNLKLYWQPNPDINCESNVEELKMILPYLCAVHVFHWTNGSERHELADGSDDWKKYIQIIECSLHNIPMIMEFVKDDCIQIAKKDAKTLKNLINEQQ